MQRKIKKIFEKEYYNRKGIEKNLEMRNFLCTFYIIIF